MPDPVEQDFTADGSEYLAVLLAMSEATDKWAQNTLDDIALVKLALGSLHGENIDVGVDVTGMAGLAAATEALKTAASGAAEGDSALAAAATAAAAASDRQESSMAGTAAAAGGLAAGFQLAHLGLTVFGAQVIADTVGIIAFGIAAYSAISDVVTSLSTLTTSYGQLDNYQRAAALSLRSFLDQMGGHEAAVFTVFNQGLSLIESHMSAAGGITQQASIAFMDFFAMLKQQFASTGWADMFSRTSGVVRTDLDALFGLINNLIGTVPALFHNFNFLGLGAIGLANDLLRLVAVVGNFDPALTRWAAGLLAVGSAYHLLSTRISWLPTFGSMIAATGLNAISATGAFQNFSRFGLVPTLSFMTGLSPAAMAATAGLAAMGAGVIALIAWTSQYATAGNSLIASLTAQDHATGLNAAGYQQLAGQLHANVAAGQQFAGASRQMQGVLLQQSAAAQQAAATARTLGANFAYLQNTYGLTRAQAAQLAQVTGVNLHQALTGSGQAAVEARSKIAAYEQTVQGARAVETQFAFDMSEATNATLAWTTRLQGLATAFKVLSGPLLGAMAQTATLKQDFAALQQAVRADGTEVGVNTQKQAALTQALAQAAQQAMTTSTALFNNAKSSQGAAAAAQAAVGPLVAMRNEILRLGLQGHAASQLVAQLNAEINALHSKTVTITTNFVTTRSWAAGNPFQPGGTFSRRQHGGPVMAGVPHLVGETAPEVFVPSAPGRILTMAQAAQLAPGRGGGGGVTWTGDVHVHGSALASKQELYDLVQQAFLDMWTRTRGTGIVPYGFGLH